METLLEVLEYSCSIKKELCLDYVDDNINIAYNTLLLTFQEKDFNLNQESDPWTYCNPGMRITPFGFK